MAKKDIICAFGTDIDSVAGWIGSYGGGDSPSDIQRGVFASEAHDGGLVPGIQISTLSGHQVLVRDIEELWVAAERMAGRPVDPLDPRFIGGGDGGR